MTILRVVTDSPDSPRVLRMETTDTVNAMLETDYLSDEDNWENPQNANMVFLTSDIVLANNGDCAVQFGIFIDSDGAPSLVMRNPIGISTTVDLSVTASSLAGNEKVFIVLPPHASSSLRVLNIVVGSNGTAFSGGGGDRNIAINDASTPYSVITTGTLVAAAVNAQWGDATIPYPASRGMNAITSPGQGLFVRYNGGTTDYTAGNLKLSVTFEMAQC